MLGCFTKNGVPPVISIYIFASPGLMLFLRAVCNVFGEGGHRGGFALFSSVAALAAPRVFLEGESGEEDVVLAHVFFALGVLSPVASTFLAVPPLARVAGPGVETGAVSRAGVVFRTGAGSVVVGRFVLSAVHFAGPLAGA